MNSAPQPSTGPIPRSAWCLLAVFALIIAGLGLFSARQGALANGWRVEAAKAGASETSAVKAATACRLEALQARAESTKATQEVERLSAALKAAQRPPKPIPAPEVDPDLVKGLEVAGLRPGLSVFRGVGPSAMARQDATLVWDWNAQAQRVPALERRLDASEALNSSQAQESAALKLEVQTWSASSEQWQLAHTDANRKNEAIQEEVKALHKAAVADNWKTAGEVAAALLGGYLLGRR